MKPIHNILFTFDKPWAIQASGQLFPNSGGVVVAFSNCQLSIVNRTSSTFHPKFSALNSKFSFSQGFLYAPFGEITTEYDINFGYNVLPKYAFNAKELDEETGMYYYEARYYKPPVFTSRDAMFEKYFWMTPYAYCANNPVKYVDPSGRSPIFPQYIYFAVARAMEHGGNNHRIRELGFGMQNPITAIRVGEYKPGKNNISTIASNFQVNVANAAGLTTGNEGDEGNAFRHVLWQGIITKEMGADQALRIGNAHEDNLKIDLSQRTFKNMSDADKAVDLLNNKIGREIGEKNKGVSNQAMGKLVAKEFFENGLWTTSQNKDGSISIKKTKITKEQYEAAIKEINKKGDNGLNR